MGKKKKIAEVSETKAIQEEKTIVNEEISEKEVVSYFEEEPEPDEFPEEFLDTTIFEEEEEEEEGYDLEPVSISFEDETRAKERALRKR